MIVKRLLLVGVGSLLCIWRTLKRWNYKTNLPKSMELHNGVQITALSGSELCKWKCCLWWESGIGRKLEPGSKNCSLILEVVLGAWCWSVRNRSISSPIPQWLPPNIRNLSAGHTYTVASSLSIVLVHICALCWFSPTVSFSTVCSIKEAISSIFILVHLCPSHFLATNNISSIIPPPSPGVGK